MKSSKLPVKTSCLEFNLGKELIPIGPSGKVFLNKKPIQILHKFEKGMPEGADFFYVGNKPLWRLAGMIYWYSIGAFEFDIRYMRHLGGFKKDDYAADHDHRNPINALILVAQQLDQSLMKLESHSYFFGNNNFSLSKPAEVGEGLPF